MGLEKKLVKELEEAVIKDLKEVLKNGFVTDNLYESCVLRNALDDVCIKAFNAAKVEEHLTSKFKEALANDKLINKLVKKALTNSINRLR